METVAQKNRLENMRFFLYFRQKQTSQTKKFLRKIPPLAAALSVGVLPVFTGDETHNCLLERTLEGFRKLTMHLFIIPGNPPALYFYQLWAEEIQREYPGCFVHISPYQLLAHSDSSLEYLQGTAALHEQELLAFQKEAKGKVTLIGHSVGAWMAFRLLEAQSAIVENCLLLYPFLQKPTFKGRVMLKSMRFLYRTSLAEIFLLGGRKLWEKFIKDMKFVTDQELRIGFALSYHEDPVIGRKRTLHIPKELREKLSMIYCEGDKWCPLRAIQAMKEFIPCEKIGASHGFITSKEERHIVLRALRKYL